MIRDDLTGASPATGVGTSDGSAIPAGDFSTWLTEMQGALRGEQGSDVPCDGCTACCTSSQFIHIGPDEIETLALIPAELRFPAPGLPSGHVVLGYDEHGCCPMLIDNQCSIYDHRPRTCRTYDCRIFPAAGLRLDDADKVLIAQRAERWRFSHPTQADRDQHAAVRAAATFLHDHAGLLPRAAGPTTTTQLAVGAVEVHAVFLRRDEATNEAMVIDPDPEVVGVELRRRTLPNG